VSADNPYAPSSVDEAVRLAPALNGYKPLGQLALLATVLQAFAAIPSAFYAADWALFGLNRLTLSDRFSGVESQMQTVAMPVYWLALLGFLLTLRQARVNLTALVETPPRYSPASMIYWFFVPVFSLWMPYRAVRAVWTASHPPQDERPRDDLLVKGWWAAYLLTIFSGVAYFLVPQDDVLVNLLTNTIGVVESLMNSLVVLSLATRQADFAQRIEG
jgi:hypothetical protein